MINCPFTLWLMVPILPVLPYPWTCRIPGISTGFCFPTMTWSSILVVSLQDGVHSGSDSISVSHKLGQDAWEELFHIGQLSVDVALSAQAVALTHRMGEKFRSSSACMHF